MPATSPSLHRLVPVAALVLLSGARAAAGTNDSNRPETKRLRATPTEVRLTATSLVRDDGRAVTLAEELAGDQPVVLDFIFTSCTTICPVMSGLFAQLQSRLGPDAARVRMVSISIDPEFDTPARLTEYGRRFHAGPQWRFYTGTAQAAEEAQRAFGAFRGDKMDHLPVTYVRGTHGRWSRLDGFASADELAAEVRRLMAP